MTNCLFAAQKRFEASEVALVFGRGLFTPTIDHLEPSRRLLGIKSLINNLSVALFNLFGLKGLNRVVKGRNWAQNFRLEKLGSSIFFRRMLVRNNAKKGYQKVFRER